MAWSQRVGAVSSERELIDLVGQLYEAAADPDSAVNLSSLMAPYFGTASSIIHTCTQSSLEMRSIISATDNLDTWAWQAYADHYHDRNVWFQRGIRKGPSVVVICQELVSDCELLRSEWYDYCQKIDWFHCLGIGVSIAPDLVGGIGFHRPRASKPFDEYDRRKAQTVLPHIERALQIQHRVSALTQERRIAFEVLDGLAIGLLLVTADARLLFANRVAERALRDGDALSVANSRVRVQDVRQRHRFERLLGEAAQTSAGRGTQAGGVLSLATVAGDRMFLLVSPFRSRHLGLGPPLPAAVIIFSDPQISAGKPEKALQALFGLTGAETRLLMALLDGQGLAEYARTAGLSINTVKTQMRQVFDKTGHDRQIDLMRTVAANPIVRLASD
jgi:DNA-binding CsgD family transcriptional regulator